MLAIFLIMLVDVMALTIILPVLPFYAERFGATPFQVGLLITTFAVCQFLSAPILGQISDRVGRRRVLLASQMGTLAGLLVLALADSLWLVFLSRLIDGVTAGNLPIAQAYISDVTKPEQRTKSLGLVGIAFGIGLFLGPAFTGFFSRFGQQYPIFAACALSLVSILATTFALPRPNATPSTSKLKPLRFLHFAQLKDSFKDRRIRVFMIQLAFFFLAYGLFSSGFALFAERWYSRDGRPFGAAEVGYIFAFGGFLAVITQGVFLGDLVRKFGERSLALFGLVVTAAGYALMAVPNSLVALISATALSGVGQSLARPSIMGLVSRNTDAEKQGATFGIIQSLYSVCQILAPPVAGTLIGHRLLVPWIVALTSFCILGFLFGLGSSQPVAGAEARAQSSVQT